MHGLNLKRPQPNVELLLLEATQYAVLAQGQMTYFICEEDAQRYAHKVLSVANPLPVKTSRGM